MTSVGSDRRADAVAAPGAHSSSPAPERDSARGSASRSGACFSPRIFPRPRYESGLNVLARLAVQLVRFPLLCCAVATATAPVHVRLRQWFDLAAQEHGLLPGQPVTSRTPWVLPVDLFLCLTLSLSLSAVYLLSNGFFWLCDEYKILQQYKMPRKPAQEPSARLVARTLRKELLAHGITAPLIMVFLLGPLLRRLNPGCHMLGDLPPATMMYRQFLTCFVVNEFMFYWGHRLLHTPFLYKRVHKQHHSYIGTRSFAAEYAHMLEDVGTAYVPYLTGLVLTRAHFHVVCVWFFCRLLETYESHSGYCFRGSLLQHLGLTHPRQAAHHDYHHTRNAGCFGNEALDWIFGTMDAWVEIGGMDGYMDSKHQD